MLARLPNARAKDVIGTLERAGFLLDHQTGSHAYYRHPITRNATTVLVHIKELPRWLLKKIIKQAGLTEDEFRAFS